VARWIANKLELRPREGTTGPAAPAAAEADQPDDELVGARSLLETGLVIAACMVVGVYCSGVLKQSGIALPSFVCVLFVGLAVCNVSALTGAYRIQPRAASLWGNIGLSLFLAEALMSLRLWELFDLALPMPGILVVQA
jgi:ESS family glutamate:Na+ symporter